MSAIAQCFQRLQAQHAKALIPYITAGDPDLDTTFKALQALDQNGADLIELGIPYSDPLADGPVIQAAATRALAKGVKLQSILEGLPALHLQAPLILFTYYNPIFQIGITDFVRLVSSAGCSGMVIPDLPVEEAQPLIRSAQDQDLDVILLVAPTSSKERMQVISSQSSGFIYLVSTTGVTGQRAALASQLQGLIQELRNQTTLPIGVGFGISTPEQARQVVQWGADAAVVGTAFVQRLAQASDPAAGLASITQFCRDLKAAIKVPHMPN